MCVCVCVCVCVCEIGRQMPKTMRQKKTMTKIQGEKNQMHKFISFAATKEASFFKGYMLSFILQMWQNCALGVWAGRGKTVNGPLHPNSYQSKSTGNTNQPTSGCILNEAKSGKKKKKKKKKKKTTPLHYFQELRAELTVGVVWFSRAFSFIHADRKRNQWELFWHKFRDSALQGSEATI